MEYGGSIFSQKLDLSDLLQPEPNFKKLEAITKAKPELLDLGAEVLRLRAA